MTDTKKPDVCPQCGSSDPNFRIRKRCVMTAPPQYWEWVKDRRLSCTDEIECRHPWHDSALPPTTPTLEPWMTWEAFEWMDAALGLAAQLHGGLKELIPAPDNLSATDRANWQIVIDTIYKSADHVDAMPQSLKDRAPRKGPHSLGIRRAV